MNIVDDNTLNNSHHIPSEINILILGAGMSGLELAKHLNHRAVKNVVVIDVGPMADGCHINAGDEYQHADKFWKNEESDKYAFRSWRSLSEPHFSKGSCLRRRVGGRSLYWHGVILPIEADALKFWPPQIVCDLTETWLGGPPLYTQVESEILVWAEKSYDVDYSFQLADFNFKITPQATRNIDSSDRWEAYSPLSYWREAGPSETILPIISGYEAIAIMISNGHCIGVKLRNIESNEVHHVLADKCVLALGTIENSRLAAQALYDSGHLIEKKITGLVDHIVQGFNVTLEHHAAPMMFRELIETHPDTIFFSHSLSGERFNLFFTLSQSDFGVELEAWTMGEQIPSINGYIKVERDDDEAIPLSISSHLSNEDNILIHKEQDELNIFWHEICQQIKIPFSPLAFDGGFSVHARTMGDVYDEFHSPLRAVDYHVPATWISPLGTENHESSTLPLGGILNERSEFKNINNLYAVGPCTFPRPGAANPSLTTLALSRRLAYILD
ncbi:GMC family oxidoreductase [Yersinia mollaretii]|uniref:GMC family oxidoreductase n=1 Tax=Yersinia mollaretii TaxID=33060 RepID=UPI0011A5072D|nr:GMC family oxidoreductase [Yersinia mollaretii]